MKIGIYGDSFCADYNCGWPSFLKKSMNCDVVDTFGLASSSADYAYMKFLETHEKYDIVIFFWTAIDRSSLIIREDSRYKFLGLCYDVREHNIINHVINRNKIILNCQIQKLQKEWIKMEYFLFKKYPNKNFLFQQSMRDAVKFKRSDCINIECFGRESENSFYNSKYGMNNIVMRQLKHLCSNTGILKKIYTFDQNMDKIRNHLTIRQNMEFCVYLTKHIKDNNFDIHETFFDPPKFYSFVDNFGDFGL